MNPYTIPLYVIGILTGLFSALFPIKYKYSKTIRIIILVVGMISCWIIQIKLTNWAYSHPFNPDDGAAKTFTLLFGGLANLIFPILPVFFLTLFSKKILNKRLNNK